ncbi:NADH dehydrogenase [ubiquinone] 1 alpha subcomplex subunit 8 [Apis mellifera caucasica]|uniref:NADH dehydrogenase [ubiquinone] 1 alpha subcomplex subunit 8 n=1 Tax=Apis mellifera TaxID=7460 RepID=A0A7M7R772_APIME|nr:NADH dehydrogenase [ubiquinone] 1 alpha subcomplex subunit 8 [Apis mellifera]KAG6803187.1 NADH dehydrogenase [ubiquinone] 1 alpha subcomplex subunit 8 [Apis mellifera caucasica]|eukprot:XP_392983.1 NADH dehydrogenase [ubiquinone] 1 alpha subcomplex subunit 8 [Apis mellifera]
MVVTKNFQLPSDEELNTQEINISWPYIHAAAVFLGKRCEWFNNEFMLCRYELKDPRKCLKEGKDVTKCALEGLQDIKKHCRNEFEAHVNCVIETSATGSNDQHCRKTRKIFDDCMKKNLNLERPSFGYFCEAKVHDSPRPKPSKEKTEYPDRVPEPVAPPYPPSKYQGRQGFNI